MSDRRVRWTADMDVNDMVASLRKMGDEYAKAGKTGQQANKMLEMSAGEIRGKIKEIATELENLKDVDAIRAKQTEMRGYEDALDAVLGKTKKLEGAQASGGGMSVGKGAFLGSFAGNLAAQGLTLISSAVGGIADSMIDGNAEIETYTASFETLLGSQEKAKSLLDDLKELGASTPFEFPELAEAGRNLVAFGFEAGQVPDILRRVGDVASGVNAPIGELSELFGKARVSGTLYAEDINQLVGRGIPVISEFAKILGVSEGQVKKLASEGKVSYATLEKALVNMTDQGGKFAGMMEKQSQTFEGLQSTAQDVLGEIGRLIGKPLFDAAKQGLVGVLEWLQSPKVQETLGNIADGIEEISSMFDSEGQAMQRVARQQRENIQNAINYNSKRIEELEGVQKLVDEYGTYAGKTKLSADEQKRLDEITGQLNSTYPGLIKNTSDYNGNLDTLRQKSDEAAGAVARLRTENDSLSKALVQSSINEQRGKIREDFEGLIDAVDEYRDKLGATNASAITSQLPASLQNAQGLIRGLTKLFSDDRSAAHAYARSLLDNEDALEDFNAQFIKLSDASKSESPFLPYMEQIRGLVASIKDGKRSVLDMQNQMNQPIAPPPPAGGAPSPTAGDDDKAKTERERKAREAFAASMAQLKREEEIELLRAQIAEASEAQLEEIRASYRQKRIEAAQRYAQTVVDLEHDVTVASLKLQLDAHKKERELMDSAAAAMEERGEQAKTFLEELQKDVDDLEIDIVPEFDANEEKMRKAADAAKGYRSTIAGIFGDVAEAAGEGNALYKAAAIGRATINTYESATGAYKSAVAIPIIGPIAGPIAAAAAIAAGLANVHQISSIKLAKGGILDRPTFVAGEAGQEIVGSLHDLIPVFREAVYGKPQKRKTRILEKSGMRISVGITNRIVGRGSRASQVLSTTGAL